MEAASGEADVAGSRNGILKTSLALDELEGSLSWARSIGLFLQSEIPPGSGTSVFRDKLVLLEG